jgi:hypothetical protein
MLFATTSYNRTISGHIQNDSLTEELNYSYKEITEIKVDGDELEKACEILGRQLPRRRVYTFLGINAQEIAKNWDSKPTPIRI